MPELSPAFGNTKVNNCRWIGGLDLNTNSDDFENPVVMIADQSRIMLVRIGDEARRIRNIQFPGCLVSSRRGTIACVADTHAYSLLDVEHQQKIPLFPISSSNEAFESGHVENIPSASHVPKRSPSPSHAYPPGEHPAVTSTSLDVPGTQLDRSNSVTPELRSASESPRSSSQEREGSSSPKPSQSPAPEPQSTGSETLKPLPPLPKQAVTRLKPHVLSPTSSEFLLVTGTEETEPGVGMFVNMDGDVVPRGMLNFHRYPESMVIDRGDDDNFIQSNDDTQEERVLAVIDAGQEGKNLKRLEVQRWDTDTSEVENQKKWVDLPVAEDMEVAHLGLRHTTSPSKLEFSEVGRLLRMIRLKTPSLPPHVPATDPRTQASIEQHQKEKELFESQELTDSEGSRKGDFTSERGWEAERNADEAKFARQLGRVQGSLIMWVGNRIWRVLRNPFTIQLDDALQNAQALDGGHKTLNRGAITEIIESVQDAEPKSEAEFIGLNYVKQKASLLLFEDLISMEPAARNDAVIETTEEALIKGDLDPRVPLLLIPLLQREVLQGPQGIWIHAGLATIAEPFIEQAEEETIDSGIMDMMKRFLFAWQQKRGYGSIMDDTYVFDSVDAALLHLLLEQDAILTAERGASPVRTELNKLVDNWKGNFDRAVALLERYHRLFILSRLYQSQKMSRNVLKTWRRIIEGETDFGGEVTGPGVEAQMRRYLVKIKDSQLVEEYGSWLAGRNPGLGIQIFADSASRVRFEPADVVALLKERAPNAVQEYLEHLVFAKNVSRTACLLVFSNAVQYIQYADDLISYYLDSVITVLESSSSARASLAESYATYRALRPPKPTYMNFITENAPSDPWWQSRLRLLQLLGGGSSTQFTSMPSPNLSYSIPTILARIEPFQDELVSESIILDGLQGRHREALRLLTHGLGDYDSAVRYCLFGGPRSTSSTGPLIEFAEHSVQSDLFKHLLDEFLRIQDVSERIERTSDLLARFAAWFEVREVLGLIPDDWSVDILSGFLAHVFRVLVSQTREARIERALSASLNLRIGSEYIEGMEKFGGYVEDPEGLRRLKDDAQQPEPAGETGEWGDMVEAAIQRNE